METKLHTQPPYPLPGAPDTREIRTAHMPPFHTPLPATPPPGAAAWAVAQALPQLSQARLSCVLQEGLTPPPPPGSGLRAPVTEQLLLANSSEKTLWSYRPGGASEEGFCKNLQVLS